MAFRQGTQESHDFTSGVAWLAKEPMVAFREVRSGSEAASSGASTISEDCCFESDRSRSSSVHDDERKGHGKGTLVEGSGIASGTDKEAVMEPSVSSEATLSGASSETQAGAPSSSNYFQVFRARDEDGDEDLGRKRLLKRESLLPCGLKQSISYSKQDPAECQDPDYQSLPGGEGTEESPTSSTIQLQSYGQRGSAIRTTTTNRCGQNEGRSANANSTRTRQVRRQQHSLISSSPYLRESGQRLQSLRFLSNPAKVSSARSLHSESTQRVSSARRRLKKELDNTSSILEQKLAELKAENKTLTALVKRQNQALDRLVGVQGELPILLKAQSEETRVLKLSLKQAREINTKYQKKLLERDNTIFNLRENNKRLKTLPCNKDLFHRHKMEADLEETRRLLESRDKEVKELMHRMRVLEKYGKQQVSNEISRFSKLKQKYKEAEEKIERLEKAIKEKDKLVYRSHIYAHRYSNNLSGRDLRKAQGNMSSSSTYSVAARSSTFSLYGVHSSNLNLKAPAGMDATKAKSLQDLTGGDIGMMGRQDRPPVSLEQMKRSLQLPRKNVVHIVGINPEDDEDDPDEDADKGDDGAGSLSPALSRITSSPVSDLDEDRIGAGIEAPDAGLDGRQDDADEGDKLDSEKSANDPGEDPDKADEVGLDAHEVEETEDEAPLEAISASKAIPETQGGVKTDDLFYGGEDETGPDPEPSLATAGTASAGMDDSVSDRLPSARPRLKMEAKGVKVLDRPGSFQASRKYLQEIGGLETLSSSSAGGLSQEDDKVQLWLPRRIAGLASDPKVTAKVDQEPQRSSSTEVDEAAAVVGHGLSLSDPASRTEALPAPGSDPVDMGQQQVQELQRHREDSSSYRPSFGDPISRIYAPARPSVNSSGGDPLTTVKGQGDTHTPFMSSSWVPSGQVWDYSNSSRGLLLHSPSLNNSIQSGSSSPIQETGSKSSVRGFVDPNKKAQLMSQLFGDTS